MLRGRSPFSLTAVQCLVFQIYSVVASIPYANWMSKFSDSLVMNLPVIPGSHNSGAMTLGANPTWQGHSLWNYAQTQNLSISDQLNLGVRLLDVRLHVIKDEMDLEDTIIVSHTYDSDLTLVDCLFYIKLFLDANPSEFVILYLRIDTAHPLVGDIDSKKSYVNNVLVASGVSFSAYTGGDLSGVKVKDVRGKVLLLVPNGTVLPSSDCLPFIDATTHYDVCSIYQDATLAQAQVTISECFPIVPVSGSISGVLNGYALDGQLDSLPPSISSIKVNNWFFSNFRSNPTWIKRERYPVQVVLIDFVTEEYMTNILSYATGINPNSLNTSNDVNVDLSSKSGKESISINGQSQILLAIITMYIASF